jgi:flagellar biosynthetic protein FlhB
VSEEAGEKTEQATDKRMKEVREKGKLSRSQDASTWVIVGACALMVPMLAARVLSTATDQLYLVSTVAKDPTTDSAVAALRAGAGSLAGTLLPLFAVAVLAAILAARAMGKIYFKKLEVKGAHFNPVNGMKKLFGPQAVWNGLKALLKSAAIGLVLWWVINQTIDDLVAAGLLPVHAVLGRASSALQTLIQLSVAAGVVLAVVDVFVTSKRNRKETKMSKQEVKDEYKQSEGDPQAKAHRRSLHHQMTRNGMISAISEADVVLVNPTHVAVALKYTPGNGAPRVTAKGKGLVAARLREVAAEKRIPLVRDIPLARALSRECEIGQEIPDQYFADVVAVLAFIMKLRTRGATGGIHTLGAPINSGPRPSKEHRAKRP